MNEEKLIKFIQTCCLNLLTIWLLGISITVNAESASENNLVYIVDNGWHTGLVVPSVHVDERFNFLRQDIGDFTYFEFGWGDKGFYQSKKITLGLTFRAVFWLTPSVMHVVGFNNQPLKYFPKNTVLALKLNSSELKKLTDTIYLSFDSESGTPQKQRNGLYGASQFYTGTGKYYALNTCNSWTVKMLSSAGIDVSHFLKLTSDAALKQVRQSDHWIEQASRIVK